MALSAIVSVMPREGWQRQLGQYALFTSMALAITFVYWRILHVNQTTVALSFLVLILFTAFRRRLSYSIYLSLLCTLLYNYFFLPPIGSFVVSDPQNLVALVAFLAAAISVNQVSARERHQTEALGTRQSEVEKLYAFSQRLLLEDRLPELSQSVPSLVAQGFQLRAVALSLPESKSAFLWDPEHLFAEMGEEWMAAPTEETSSRTIATVNGGIRIVPLMVGLRASGLLAMAECDYSDSIYDAIGSLTAITMERATALDRNNREQAAREGELLRAAILDSITHELRTPLTGISMAATTLLEGASLDEPSRLDLARVISEESTRLNRLIEEAVVMARLGAGDVHVLREPSSIAEVMHAALDEVRGRLRNRQVHVEVAPNIPKVPMDADLMRRVWKHLLENAMQYSPGDSPIRLVAEKKQEKIQMRVEDDGPGIARQEQPLIFERFFRGANRKLHAEGTGMGLAIVKAILEAHQGGIEVRSERGKGTAFLFWIPAA